MTAKEQPTTSRTTTSLLLFLCTIAVLPEPALGAGLEFPDLGTVALGRGTAFVASANNPSAFYYNPAGLSKAKRFDLLLSLHLVHQKVRFSRTGSGAYWLGSPGEQRVASCPESEICVADPDVNFIDGRPGAPFSSVTMSRVGVLPVLVANWSNVGGIKGLAIAAGLLPPASFGTNDYPQEGAQRYVLVSSNHLMVFPGVGLAYGVGEKFRIGAVFLSGIAKLEQTLMIRPLPSIASPTMNESRGGDAKMSIHARDPFVPTAILGVMSKPVPWLEAGVSVKLPAKIRAEGTMSYEAPLTDMANSYMAKGDNKIELTQQFPLRLRLGVRYIHRRFDVEVNGVYEQWSRLKQFDIKPTAGVTDPINEYTEQRTAMPETAIPKRFRDTWSLRVGGDISPLPERLTLRMGGFYQQGAYPKHKETFAIDFPYDNQFGLSGGLSILGLGKFSLHLGYQHIFQPRVTVKNGIVQQQGLPLSTGEEIGNTVNNGTYDVSLNLFSLAAEAAF